MDLTQGAGVGWWALATLFLLVFALLLLIIGIFTAYFGSGKSRGIGVGFLVLGLVIGIAWSWLIGPGNVIGKGMYYGGEWLKSFLVLSIAMLGVAIVGALAAVGIFLLVIMKS